MNTTKQESKSEFLFFTKVAKGWYQNLPANKADRNYCILCAYHYMMLAHLSLLDYLR